MPQPKQGRNFARLAAAGLALAALAAAGLVLALPGLVERRVLAILDDAGIDDAALAVERVGWNETVISGLRIGRDLSASRVVLRYAPGDLVDGRVREVVVSGLALNAAISPDGLSLGALDRLGGRGGAAGAVAVGAITLREARIEVASPLGAITVTADGAAEFVDGGGVRAQAEVAVQAPPGRFGGTLTLTANGGGEFAARLDIADGAASLPPFRAGRVTGSVTAQGTRAALEAAEVRLSLADVALPLAPPTSGEVAATLAGGRLSADGALYTADGGFVITADTTVADIAEPASRFVIEGEVTVADAGVLDGGALGGAAPAGVAGRGRVGFTLSGVLPDRGALGTAHDFGAGLATLSLAGALDLALEGVALPGIVAGLSMDGRVTAETAGGALAVTAGDGLRLTVARLDPALLDALGVPAMARPHLDGPLALVFEGDGATLVHIRPTPGSVVIDAAARGRLELAGGAVVTAVIDATVETDGRGAPQRFSLRRLDASAGGLALAGAEVALDTLRLNLAGTPASFAGGARVELSAKTIALAGLSVDRPRLTANAAIAFRDGGLAVSLAEGTRLDAAGLSFADLFQTTGPVVLHAVAAEQPALTIDFDAAGAPVLRHRLRLAMPVVEGAALLPGGAVLAAAVALPEVRLDGADGGAGTIVVAGGVVRLPAYRFALDGIDGTLNMDALGPAMGRLADFTVGALRHTAEPPLVAPLRLAGAVDRDGGGFSFTGRIGDRDGRLAIAIRGRHDLDGGAGHADFAAERLRFDPDALRPGDLAPPLAGMVGDVSGTVAAEGRLAWGGSGGPVSGMRLLVEDVSFEAGGARLERLNAVVDFDSLWPPSTPPDQQLAIGLVDAGLPLADGLVAFRLTPGGTLEVESAVWRWAGGAIRTGGLVIDADAVRHAAVLEVAGLDLGEVVGLANINGLAATGRLSGRVPVAFAGDGLVIENGRLEAEGGVLRYAPSGAPAALRQAGEGATLMLGALENFAYETMRITLDRKAGGEAEIGVHLRGSNPDFYDGYPVEFNLGVSGALDTMLRRGLEGYRVPDAIRERLQGFGG